MDHQYTHTPIEYTDAYGAPVAYIAPILASRIAAAPRRHGNDYPLWQGPCHPGPMGGITQSMLVRFLSCRERFRLRYVCGLEPHDKWNHHMGYGNMWHACEEAHARGDVWTDALVNHTTQIMLQYPMQKDEIGKWYGVCCVQFPEYVRYWADHPDVQNRTPVMQEEVFHVPYNLPSGRTVFLRGKFDSVDLIDHGVYLQENKTKSDIDKMQVERQLKFDLQTMLYLTALQESKGQVNTTNEAWAEIKKHRICGVRYNVVRRPLSGGKGSIFPHKAKYTKTKTTPAETQEEFYERLRRDYIAADPEHWFFRVRAEISAADIKVFRRTCLDPLLETLGWWYDEVMGNIGDGYLPEPPPMNYRTPFGVYSALEDNGATEYDAYLDNGSEAGLRRVETLFNELQ